MAVSATSSPPLRTLKPAGSISRPAIEIAPPDGPARGAPEHRLDPRDELGQLEGLRDVVVGAELEPDDDVVQLAPRREHHDRHLALTADLTADLEPVQRRKHHVEDDEVERPLLETKERIPAVAGGRDAKAGLLEAEAGDLPDGGVVLHEQHVLVHARKPIRGSGQQLVQVRRRIRGGNQVVVGARGEELLRDRRHERVCGRGRAGRDADPCDAEALELGDGRPAGRLRRC